MTRYPLLHLAWTRRDLLRSLVAVGGVVTLQACGGASAAPTTPSAAAAAPAAKGTGAVQHLEFTTFYTGPDGANMQKIVETFNTQHPSVQVKFSSPGWGADYITKLQAAALAGNPPAIVALHNYEIPPLAQSLYPLGSDISAIKLDPALFLKAAWDLAMYQGKQYGVTMSTGTMALIYNKGLFEAAKLDPTKPPTNTQQFIAAGKAIAKPSAQQWGFSRDPNWMPWLTMLWQNGGELLSPDNKQAAFSSTAGKEALQAEVDFIQQQIAPPGPDPIDFYKGKLGMIFTGPWELAKLIETNSKAGTKFGWARYPIFFSKKPAVESTSHIYCLMKPKQADTAKKEAALTFLQWVVTTGSAQWTRSQIPSYTKSRDAMKTSTDPVTKEMGPWIEQAPMSVVPPAIVQWNQFFATVKQSVESAIYKHTPIDQALGQSATKVNTILGG